MDLTMQTVIAFLALLLPLTLTPGPATIALAGLGMKQGLLKSLPFYFGLLAAVFVIAVASAYGLTAILTRSDMIQQVIRTAGIAYILYLGVKVLRSKPAATAPASSGYTAVDGIVLTALNPKFYVMVVAVFSQFIGPEIAHTWVVIVGFTAVLAASLLIWLVAGAGLRPLMNSPRALRIQSLVFGLSLIGVGLYLLTEPIV